ncbi:MAG: hypothetical protein H0V82_00015 [Candidatus Protochlamydia sp.]|nr:hypothetical protein [Candidatus Protochlamydia sp.]
MRSNFDVYLKTFFENELRWVADGGWQRKSWENANDEMFGEFLMIIYQSWSVIEENKINFNLTNSQYMQVKKIFDMIESFQTKIEYPTNRSEHLALLSNQEWNNIQNYARETIENIYPKLF